jgi:predicted dienelactone hydrolase
MSKTMFVFMIIVVIGLTLSACSPTATMPTATATIPLVTQEPVSFSLSEPGPYFVSKVKQTIVDESRADREIQLTIWYPALEQTDDDGRTIYFDAEPDVSAAPYPLILTDPASGSNLFRSHLSSHGFVMVVIDPPGFSNTTPWNNYVVDVPLDFLFVLEMLTSNPLEGLDGVLDTNRVGVGGYSSGGLFSLALGGARINPEYYLSQCAQAYSPYPPPSILGIGAWYFCELSESWDEFSSQVGAEISTVSEGLWQPTTDDRILAIMPMAPDSPLLYGAEGLAAINIPSLMIAGTADTLVSYEFSSCYIYEHLVNADRILISFIGEAHMMVEKKEIRSRINHFAVAFFGYYLQGHKEYADYFSEDFVSQFDDLYWDMYQDE